MILTRNKTMMSAVLAFVLCVHYILFTSVNVSEAATTNKPVTVTLGKNATAQINNVQIFSQDKGLYLIYTLTIINAGSTNLQLSDYWSKLRSTSGKTYTTSLIEKDKKIAFVPPKSSVDLTFYANVDDNVKLSNLVINMIRWDFSAPNYTKSLGSFLLSKGYGTPTKAFASLYITTKESKLKTAINSVSLAVGEEDQSVSINYLLENLNSRNYRLANMQFYLVTDDGATYAAKTEDLKDLVVQPKSKKTITLNFRIPRVVNLNSSKLVTGYISEAESLFIPIGSYVIPKGVDKDNSAINRTIYNNYLIELEGYNRIPSGSKDMLTAIFKITNQSNIALKVPAVKAAWSINGVTQDTATPNGVAFDQINQIAPKESTKLAVSVTIPYSVKVENIVLTLSDVVDAQSTNLIGSFKSSSVNKFEASNSQQITFSRDGNKTLLELLSVRANDLGKQSIVFGDIAIINLEPRPVNGLKYIMYLQTKEGQIYPLSMSDYAKGVVSNGRVLLQFSGSVPKTTKDEPIKLLFAEQLPLISDQPSSQTVTPINITSVIAKPLEDKISTNFKNLKFGKYNISFDRFYAYLDASNMSVQGIKLEYMYSLLTDQNVDDMAGSYKLRFEFEDQEMAKATYTKEYEFNVKDQADPLLEGQSIKQTVTFNDPNILDKISMFSKYKLSVYLIVNDQKILLAQNTNSYFNVQALQ